MNKEELNGKLPCEIFDEFDQILITGRCHSHNFDVKDFRCIAATVYSKDFITPDPAFPGDDLRTSFKVWPYQADDPQVPEKYWESGKFWFDISNCEKVEVLSRNVDNEASWEQQGKEGLLQFFTYKHLPIHLQVVSKMFAWVAESVMVKCPRNPERTVALQKLLEANDCAVRAMLWKEDK